MTFMAKHDSARTCEQSSVPVSEKQGKKLTEYVLLWRNDQTGRAGTVAREVFLAKGLSLQKTMADHSVEHAPFCKHGLSHSAEDTLRSVMKSFLSR